MARRVQGSPDVRLLECTSPARNRWRVRWDVHVSDDGSADYMEAEFDHKPTAVEIRSEVFAWCNGKADESILSGFTYGDALVWLSQENQHNYKTAYDLAVQTGGKTLPVTFKFGTDVKPVYREFKTVEDLSDFYTKAVSHIQNAQADAWKRKDTFKVEDYIMES